MILENTRVCPICESSKKKIIKHINISVPIDFILPVDYNIVVCDDCGFVFNDVPFSKCFDDYYANYKGNTNFNIPTEDNYILNQEKRISKHVKSANFIERNTELEKDASILDIGCSYGGTLSILKHKGFSNLYAIDLDVESINYLKNTGINSQVGSIFSDNIPEFENKFDLIILGHILEHLHEPKKAISNISKWLKPNGKIFIECPDLYQYPQTIPFPGFFAEWEHVNHFSIISIMNLMNNFRLKSYDTGRIYVLIENFPCLYAIFEKSNEIREYCKTKNDENCMLKSLTIPNEIGSKTLLKIANLENKEIAIWGAGQYLYRLLSHTQLKGSNIKYIVDKDEKKQKDTLLNIQVSSPEVLKDFKGTIVICSTTAKDYILTDIQTMGLTNPVVIPFI